MERKKTAAILLMGGSGLRFGSEVPKQFHRLSGKKVYQHTLEKFLGMGFNEIILVCNKEWLPEINDSTVKVVKGGINRQQSSYLGLLACSPNTDIVVIHDAVRPFVNERIIRENIEGALIYGAVDTCLSSADTIVHSINGHSIANIPSRSEYLRGQTPQSFSYPLILQAHERFSGENASDDCSLVLKLGYPIHIIQGDEHNIKITTELDLFIAEQLLRLAHVQLPLSNKTLVGKKFIVTGATGGIGKEIIHLLEKEGATPICISRNAPEFSVDLTLPLNVESIFEKIYQKYGFVDGLINCIGQFRVKGLNELSSQEIEEQIAVNLTSLIYCCKWAKLKEDGHIVNISSSSYSKGRKEYPIYSSAKAAVVNFTQALASELKNLKVNAIVPTRTNTSARKEQFPLESPQDLLPPEQVAQTIVNLLKQNLTGSIIEVR